MPSSADADRSVEAVSCRPTWAEESFGPTRVPQDDANTDTIPSAQTLPIHPLPGMAPPDFRTLT
jgi:hypothetical protein